MSGKTAAAAAAKPLRRSNRHAGKYKDREANPRQFAIDAVTAQYKTVDAQYVQFGGHKDPIRTARRKAELQEEIAGINRKFDQQARLAARGAAKFAARQVTLTAERDRAEEDRKLAKRHGLILLHERTERHSSDDTDETREDDAIDPQWRIPKYQVPLLSAAEKKELKQVLPRIRQYALSVRQLDRREDERVSKREDRERQADADTLAAKIAGPIVGDKRKAARELKPLTWAPRKRDDDSEPPSSPDSSDDSSPPSPRHKKPRLTPPKSATKPAAKPVATTVLKAPGPRTKSGTLATVAKKPAAAAAAAAQSASSTESEDEGDKKVDAGAALAAKASKQHIDSYGADCAALIAHRVEAKLRPLSESEIQSYKGSHLLDIQYELGVKPKPAFYGSAVRPPGTQQYFNQK